MVKSDGNSSSEEGPRKKQRKHAAAVPTAVWPCQMNGCTKQFAREADLKRHQRTTKLHSPSNFACPQCDAAFTRADALRRHQKARHSGVFPEAARQTDAKVSDKTRQEGSGSKSPSPTASPDLKKEKKPRQQKFKPASPPLAGTSASHYRQHTAETMSASFPHPPRLLDGQYGIGTPTFSARLNQVNQAATQTRRRDGSPSHAESSVQGGSSGYTPVRHHQSPRRTSDKSRTLSPGNPAPAPRTWSSTVIRSPSRSPDIPTPPDTVADIRTHIHQGSRHTRDRRRSVTPAASHERRLPSCHSHGLQHILTEDGETMLNPAELLTQESLSSPPSSS